jgi:hypothetical protein
MHLRRGFCLLGLLLSATMTLAAGFPAAASQTLTVGNLPRAVVVFPTGIVGRPAGIAVANSSDNTVSVFAGRCINSTTCNFALRGTFPVNSFVPNNAWPTSIAAGRFRGPGAPVDLVTANNLDNSVTLQLNTGAAIFASGSPIAAGASPQTVVVGDFNGDGFADIAVTNGKGPAPGYTPSVTVLLNQGNCTPILCPAGEPLFTADVSSPYALANSNLPWGLAKGNFKGAGDLDLVVSNYYSQNYGAFGASVLLNTRGAAPMAGPRFTPATWYQGGFYASYVATGHFSTSIQPKDDFAITQLGGTVRVFRNNGAGVFSPTYVQSAAGTTPVAIANAGDLNLDGIDDLVVSNLFTNQVTVLVSTGVPGSYVPLQTITVGNAPVAVFVSPLGVAGNTGLLVVNENDGTVEIHEQ